MAKQDPFIDRKSDRLYKGINQDVHPSDQPQGTYRFALNTINESNDGKLNFLRNEESNEICDSLPDNYVPIGSVYIGNNKTVIFSTDGVNSEIGIIDSSCDYETKVNNQCLFFNDNYRIDAVHRVRRGCEDVIYFTDGINPVRYFNFSKPEDFQDDVGDWNCDLFELFLPYKIPCFQDIQIEQNGVLNPGTHNFSIQYLDEDLNPTEWIYSSQPVDIFHDSLEKKYEFITGSSLYNVDALGGKTLPTTKSILLTLSNLDEKYPFYRIARIEASSFNGTVSKVYASPEIPTSVSQYLVDGNLQGWFEIPVEDIIIKGERIETAQHIEQLENRLLLANTSGKDVNFCKFQPFASKIASRYKVATASSVDTASSGNPKCPNTHWEEMSFMADEVYAIGIVYVFDDGSESPAYHIPGRGKDTLWDFDQQGCVDCNLAPEENESCILVYERTTDPDPPSTSCVTEYTVTYELDGVPQSITKTITNPNFQSGWVTLICEEGVITNAAIGVINQLCTAIIGSQVLVETNIDANPCSIIINEVTECNKCIYVTVDQPTPIDPTCVTGSTVSIYYKENGVDKVITTDEFLVGSGITTKEVICFTDTTDVTIINSVLNNLDPINCTDGNLISVVIQEQDPTCVPEINTTVIPYSDIADSEIIQTWSHDIEHIIPQSQEADYNAGLIPKLERWQVFNTAIPINNTTGNMAFWQTTSQFTYNEILDCNGEDYWGNDFCGNPLVNEPIRHHKFPSRNLIDLYNYSGSNVILNEVVCNIEFTGATFPTGPFNLEVQYFLNGNVNTFTISDITEENFNSFNEYEIVIASTTDVVQNISTLSTNLTTDFTITYSVRQVGPINSERTTYLLGIEFDNIEYPDDRIVGHYFVRGERDKFNRTILSKGIVGKLREDNESNIMGFTYFQDSSGEADLAALYYYSFYPDLMFFNDAVDGIYLKLESEFGASGINKVTSRKYESPDGAAVFKGFKTEIIVRNQGFLSSSPVAERNYTIDKALILDGASFDNRFRPNYTIYNTSLTNRIQVLKLNTPLSLDNPKYLPYISYKVDRNIHTNLLSMKYYRMHNCQRTLESSQIVFGGDIFLSQIDLCNSLFFEFVKGLWDNILLGVGIVAAAVLTVFTAGAAGGVLAGGLSAIGIGANAGTIAGSIAVSAVIAGTIGVTSTVLSGLIDAYKNTDLDKLVEDDELDDVRDILTNFIAYANEIMQGMVWESEYNLALRQDYVYGDDGEFFKPWYNQDDYFRGKIMYYDQEEENESKKWKPRGVVTPEIYHYNLDYSRQNKESIYFPLPSTYECCSDCLENFPTRIAWSNQSFQEEKADNYRIFKINNYKDIEANHGEITALSRKNNSLLVFCEQAVWRLPQNLQTQVTGELTTYIGTGEFFSNNPLLVVDADNGTAGTIHKWSIIKTPFATLFGSEYDSKVYEIRDGGGLVEISKTGLRNYFENNYQSFLRDQIYGLADYDYPLYNAPSSVYGTGVIATYDPRHERYIFTLKDYKIKDEYVTDFVIAETDGTSITGLVQPTSLFFDKINLKFAVMVNQNDFIYVELNNGLYFNNKSFTISYSYLSQSWISWHSYLPHFYYYDSSNFYSSIDNVIWKHNIDNSYQIFYNGFNAHIIEYVMVANPIQSKVWDTLYFITEAYKFDQALNNYFEERYITHDYVTLYNSRQCSGRLGLTVKDTNSFASGYIDQQIIDIPGEIIIDRNEKNWSINNLCDYRVNYNVPIWNTNENDLQPDYYIDKILNLSSLDNNKTWFEIEKFRDKYLIVRLEFSKFDNVELLTKYLLDQGVKSYR